MAGPGSHKMARLLRDYDGQRVEDIHKYGRLKLLHYYESAVRITTLEVGVSVPLDGTPGYSSGAIFIDVDAPPYNGFYINDGDKAACDFNLVVSSGTAFTAGVLATVTGIDGTAVGVTPLYTATEPTTPLLAVIRVEAVNACTVMPTLGLGVAAGETDIVASHLLVGPAFTATTENRVLRAGDASREMVATETVSLGIDVGATAVGLTLAVDLVGYTR